MDPKELEASIRTSMATAFLQSLPDDTKTEILAASVERTLQELCSSYLMKSEIEAQLQEYMRVYIVEYLKDPKVQDRLKELAHEAVDIVHEAVLASMAQDVQRAMKSKYMDFVKDMKDNK